MKFYKISEARVKRVINYPDRYEEGIVPGTIAVMQKAGTKKYSEIWVMYKIIEEKNNKFLKNKFNFNKNKKIKIITVWRYPGISPKRNPIPPEVLKEVEEILG
jgi:hypothetical protein